MSRSKTSSSPFLNKSGHCLEDDLFSRGGDLTKASLFSNLTPWNDEGGFGKVRIVDVSVYGKVAMKAVTNAPGATKVEVTDSEKELSKEAELMHSLGACSSVIPIYAAGQTPLGYAIVMPSYTCNLLVLQSSFYDHARENDLQYLGIDPKTFFSCAVPMVSALAFLHFQGVAHLDIKSMKYMVNAPIGSPAGQWDVGFIVQSLVLIDFGLSAKFGETYRGGTPNHIAPESLTDDGRTFGVATPEVDLFALAVTLRSLMTGEVRLVLF